MTDDLAARRAAVAARLERARRERLELLRQAAPDGTAAAILRSRRKHPSNSDRPYDQQEEEQ